MGYEFLTASDHVAVEMGGHRSHRFFDPLATFAYLAAHTDRIRFLPQVVVIGLYHPLEIAKRYGTLDHLSGGRLTLGFGVGHLRQEFDILGASFDDRGPRADDALKALRETTGRARATYHGEFYHYTDMMIEPHSVQCPIPTWVGGHSMKALRRAATLAQGWAPPPPAFRGPTLKRNREMLDKVETPPPFDVCVAALSPLDPMGSPGELQDAIGESADSGATVFKLTVRHASLSEYLEQLEAYADIANLTSLPVSHSRTEDQRAGTARSGQDTCTVSLERSCDGRGPNRRRCARSGRDRRPFRATSRSCRRWRSSASTPLRAPGRPRGRQRCS